MIDLSDPRLNEQLRRRTPEGRYEISEIEIVQSIRAHLTEGKMDAVRKLSEVLLLRCAPAFQYHSQGLRHRPDLREEAIANMGEHMLRDAQNSKEVFMTKNFIHYLRCLCADEFKRILRQEGLQYRRDEEGRPAGRPQHVPRALVESISRPLAADEERSPVADVADPHDQYEHMHSAVESQRILNYLVDDMDRKIMVLRAIQGLKWDDIALLCRRTERTVRMRYERARSTLHERILREQSGYIPTVQKQ